MNPLKSSCPKMIRESSLPIKSASSNARFRRRPTFGLPSRPPVAQVQIPSIPTVPLHLLNKGQTHEHEHGHEHTHGGYKRSCHGHCSKAKTKPVAEIKVSEVIFAKNKIRLPKIPNREFINDPVFQENMLRDLLSMAEKKKVCTNKHLVGEIKEEIFRHFKFEKKKIDSIVNYIDTILVATEKTKEEAKNTIDFMQETRDKCQKLDIQMEDFLEGVRESLTSLKKEDLVRN